MYGAVLIISIDKGR